VAVLARFFSIASGARPRIHVMTQALLAARFKLTFHRATTEMSVYSLVIGMARPSVDHHIVTGKELIGFAYDVEGYRVSAQGSISSEPYDVIAKVPEDAAKLPWEERCRR
jgi:hypothetical protein